MKTSMESYMLIRFVAFEPSVAVVVASVAIVTDVKKSISRCTRSFVLLQKLPMLMNTLKSDGLVCMQFVMSKK